MHSICGGICVMYPVVVGFFFSFMELVSEEECTGEE